MLAVEPSALLPSALGTLAGSRHRTRWEDLLGSPAEGRCLTFESRGDADAWLALQHSEILRNEWLPPTEPKAAPICFEEYAVLWLKARNLAQRTREHYEQLLRDHVDPKFGHSPVPSITPAPQGLDIRY